MVKTVRNNYGDFFVESPLRGEVIDISLILKFLGNLTVCHWLAVNLEDNYC